MSVSIRTHLLWSKRSEPLAGICEAVRRNFAAAVAAKWVWHLTASWMRAKLERNSDVDLDLRAAAEASSQ